MSTSKATETPEKVPDLSPSFQETMASSLPIFQTQFACMTFNMFDRIRLINFTEAEVSAIKEVVAARWSPGLSHVQPYGESMEFRLRGSPWLHRSGGNDDSRRLMLRILEKLFDMGWVLQGAMEITLKSESKDSLIFRKQDPIPSPCDWICISFDNHDKLKIIDSPPKDLTDAILQIFGRDKTIAEAEREVNEEEEDSEPPTKRRPMRKPTTRTMIWTSEDDVSSAAASLPLPYPKSPPPKSKQYLSEILANIRRQVEVTCELKIQEKEDVAYSGLPKSLTA
ncbi:hypothetical protein FAGAP_2672 [Fusarium agapanthi]|uniref:Uncharacterized protein n=1 Tax=Fusarium agapanthi TaxID=1803897 RepID=A0A9P5BF43_9HYPO|nr:hypothetical protein FAGAP_2672 [Fusarium agapanthi]